MQKKKNIILNKIVKKDYNNELEKILEEKQFGENVKSTLLSILYKIETYYKDYETVKKDVETKEEYISNILDIIKKDCSFIKINKMSDKQSEIPENKTFVINKEKKEIISYPIERKLLYAILKISNKEKIIKDDYFLINNTLSELINVGNNINKIEPLRDFNGYSWTVSPKEIESIDHNLVYQNLRILVGSEILNKWVKNSEYIIDYYNIFEEKLENKYGKENKNKIIEIISNISILLYFKYNNHIRESLLKQKKEIENQLKKMENKHQLIEETTEKKLQITEEIKQIDTIINNKKLLQQEYEIRNEKLPLQNKIFSMRILSKIMEEEKKEKLKELENLNNIINPQNFVNKKRELEKKEKLLKIIEIEDKEKELNKYKIRLQKQFLKMLEININKVDTKQEIEKIIYNFRYYLLLQYDDNNTIKDIKEIQENIKQILKLIIEKAIQLKVLNGISKDEETNYNILKNIFTVRIIKLEDAYFKITKENEKYFIQIFDENIFEEKIEISEPKDIDVHLGTFLNGHLCPFWDRY